jgi:hypothetical protein
MTTYYAQVDSHNELIDVDTSILVTDGYGSTNVQNIEVSEKVYKNQAQYMYSNGKIVKNPNYEAEQLEKAKESKYEENNNKAEIARYNQEFTVVVQGNECIFDTTEKTQTDLNTATNYCLATGGTYDGWVTNNGIELNLSLEDISLIAQEFKEKANVYIKWNEYKTAIDNASTVKEVNRIKINY